MKEKGHAREKKGRETWERRREVVPEVGERMSHMGRDVTILRSDSECAPSFCQKLELKSERYNSILDPDRKSVV